MRNWALNLAVPLLAAALAFGAIVHAQAHQLDYETRPRAACLPTLTDANVGYFGAITSGPNTDLFVAESRAQCIVRIDSAGVGHYVVGGGGRDGCPACGARIGFPIDVEVTPDGTVHLIDQAHYQLVGVRPDGRTTVERGAQRSAQVQAVAQGRDGRLYAGDYEFVTRLDPTGWVVLAGGGRGELQLGAALPATSVRVSQISSLSVGPDGTVYIAQRPLYRVLRVDPAGMLSVFAGTGLEGDSGDGGPATGANIYPDGLAVDDAGNVYISSQLHHRVRRVDRAGTITNFAGQSAPPDYGAGYGDGRPATSAQLRFPTDLAWRDGNLYILDGHRARKVDRSGIMTTVAGG